MNEANLGCSDSRIRVERSIVHIYISPPSTSIRLLNKSVVYDAVTMKTQDLYCIYYSIHVSLGIETNHRQASVSHKPHTDERQSSDHLEHMCPLGCLHTLPAGIFIAVCADSYTTPYVQILHVYPLYMIRCRHEKLAFQWCGGRRVLVSSPPE